MMQGTGPPHHCSLGCDAAVVVVWGREYILRHKGVVETNLPDSPEMMRGVVPVESGGGICRVAGMMPYAGLMTAEHTAGEFACKTAGYT